MINIIVAKALNGVIGKDGKMPWFIEGELEQFKRLTTGNVVVMGRKTYEAIGHPLANRDNVVISNTVDYHDTNLITLHSLSEAIKLYNDREIYLAGGYGIYKEGLALADRLYITIINGEYDGDVYFPEINDDDYDIALIEGNKEYKRYLYTRKANDVKKDD